MKASRTDRICRFEQMEPRRLLAADALPVALGPAVGLVDEAPMAVGTAPGSIAGQVTMSADNSGLEGVMLRLLGETGNLLGQTQTDTAGNYEFANLAPGIYAVLEIQPSGIREGGARVGSGGGVAFDHNLLGEIVVYSGSDLVGYNFYELAAEELSEVGAEEDRAIVRHSGGDQTGLADAALWLLYGSSPVALASRATPLESPAIFVSEANDPLALPVTSIPAAPFYGSFSHADTKSTASDENLDIHLDDNELGIFREDLEIVEQQSEPKRDDREPETKDYDRVFELSERAKEAVGVRISR